jgi:hypothetical protein
MDRHPSGVATIVVNMRIITFGRTVVVPLSLVVMAVAGFGAPVALRSVVVLVAIGAIGLTVFSLARQWHASRQVRPLPRMDDVVQIAKDDASDLARMGSDAG